MKKCGMIDVYRHHLTFSKLLIVSLKSSEITLMLMKISMQEDIHTEATQLRRIVAKDAFPASYIKMNVFFKQHKMRVLVCINDKNLPEGASVKEGAEYIVQKEFINPFGQKAYLLVGVTNEGRTPRGLHWYGYAAERFAPAEGVEVKNKEYAFALN